MIIPPLCYLERYRNQGTRTYSRHSSYTEANDNYRPDSENENFGLQALTLPVRCVKVYRANPPQELESCYLRDNTVRFLIHPQVLSECPDDPYIQQALEYVSEKETLSVVPSSSTRTLFVTGHDYQHAAKVHFPFKVSRYTRKMRDEVIEQAVNVSLELEKGIDKMSADFAFLREVLGVSFASDESRIGERGENWGYVIRDMVPFPVSEEQGTLIPGFALYGQDYFDAGISLLLYELIGESDPLEYVTRSIMFPVIRHWIECFRHFGYLMEPHGQNVLLELDQAANIKRIVHRDLSVGIDMRRRRDLGISSDNLNQYNRMEDAAFHSIAYDRFMGNHFFSRLVDACIHQYPHLSREDFTLPCRDLFASLLPEYRDYFPENVWYFSEERDKYNKPLYQDTGESPEWRPVG